MVLLAAPAPIDAHRGESHGLQKRRAAAEPRRAYDGGEQEARQVLRVEERHIGNRKADRPESEHPGRSHPIGKAAQSRPRHHQAQRVHHEEQPHIRHAKGSP